jgi:hypothetical protein
LVGPHFGRFFRKLIWSPCLPSCVPVKKMCVQISSSNNFAQCSKNTWNNLSFASCNISALILFFIPTYFGTSGSFFSDVNTVKVVTQQTQQHNMEQEMYTWKNQCIYGKQCTYIIKYIMSFKIDGGGGVPKASGNPQNYVHILI